MECQRRPIRLTDQALVAVEVARRLAEAAGSAPNAAHLVAGLASEPDGVAGVLLADPAVAPQALVERALPPGLPALDAVLRQAVHTEGSPLWTLDLLQATLQVGGAELDEVLVGAGHNTADLRDLLALPEWRNGAAWLLPALASDHFDPEPLADPETRGLPPLGTGPLTAAAALAVARAGAQRGRARDVALALQVAQEREWPPGDLLLGLQLARQHSTTRASADDAVTVALQAGDAPVGCATLACATMAVLLG